ncbi:hydroxymethylglutaryl-CoA synthase [Aerococcaceae bacterium zg-BR33]|nr:hydroxymethylglutaryl-CoA synthase [Aerococcaceae bacterium zg-BR22]MBS4457026.1 hydroxymethylglutaryl-CoA synthase [Aerococcaceae bacterium zg-A91]MBS4458867.1 hydroxymethylglutaryl-CoA synthase [Aerococcaceae bacterium zg-BR33]
MQVKIGIDKIGFYVPSYYMDMRELATYRGIDPNKWTIGIGQEKMAVAPLTSDVVAMAANAAASILTPEDKASIDQVIVGTESGVDFSKSIATFVHEMLGIQPFAKAFEIKQACYGATAGLQMACDYVRLRPERKVLVIATDIARYGLNTGGEATQGAGAVAMLVSAMPRILAIDEKSYMHTNHQFDFWRPNHSEYALVDGQFSTKLYQDEFVTILEEATRHHPTLLDSLEAIVFHLPFTKMGRKALLAYEASGAPESHLSRWLSHYDQASYLNRMVGNIYTGSMFLSLLSLLAMDDSLQEGQRLGLFSYGSGAVAELIIGQLQPGFAAMIDKAAILAHLERREALTVERYETVFLSKICEEDTPYQALESGYYLKKVVNHQRIYDYQQ